MTRRRVSPGALAVTVALLLGPGCRTERAQSEPIPDEGVPTRPTPPDPKPPGVPPQPPIADEEPPQPRDVPDYIDPDEIPNAPPDPLDGGREGHTVWRDGGT